MTPPPPRLPRRSAAPFANSLARVQAKDGSSDDLEALDHKLRFAVDDVRNQGGELVVGKVFIAFAEDHGAAVGVAEVVADLVGVGAAGRRTPTSLVPRTPCYAPAMLGQGW
jgi:hypothetical protein